jgi:chemotaxis family two-component system response regulator Rcp1
MVVLYVEDDDATAYLFQEALGEADIQVRLFRVSDGEQALSFLRRDGLYCHAPTPDLLVLDLNLPRVHGFDVLADVSRSEMLRHIRRVVFSSSARPEDIEKARTLGADEYVIKPSDLDGFVAAVAGMCGASYLSNVLRSA